MVYFAIILLASVGLLVWDTISGIQRRRYCRKYGSVHIGKVVRVTGFRHSRVALVSFEHEGEEKVMKVRPIYLVGYISRLRPGEKLEIYYAERYTDYVERVDQAQNDAGLVAMLIGLGIFLLITAGMLVYLLNV